VLRKEVYENIATSDGASFYRRRIAQFCLAKTIVAYSIGHRLVVDWLVDCTRVGIGDCAIYLYAVLIARGDYA
jgi:hypothetical protein